jgi:uncharacterized protein YlzI (FlbEa/FlbD family)
MKMNILQKNQMEDNYFSLEVNKNNKVIRIFQIVFGTICAALAVVWLIMNIDTLKSNNSLWVSIIFLLGFAWYQINSGLGKGDKFLQIGQTSLKFKKNSLLPVRELNASEIKKIEIFPLSMVIFLISGKKNIMRFGTTYTDVIEPIKKGIENFCTLNNLELEFRKEEL